MNMNRNSDLTGKPGCASLKREEALARLKETSDRKRGEESLILRVDLSDMTMQDRNFKGLTFSVTSLVRANMIRCDLQKAFIWQTDMCDANFSQVDISHALIYQTKMERILMNGVSGESASIIDCLGQGATFSDFHQQGFSMVESRFRQCSFKGAILDQALFRVCFLEKSEFREASLQGTWFWNCVLRGTDFSGADLRNANFEDSDLTEAQFQDADCRGVLASAKQMEAIRKAGGLV